MKRLLHISAAVVCAVILHTVAAQTGMGTEMPQAFPTQGTPQADSTSTHRLDSTVISAIEGKLEEYFRAMERETAEVKCKESDFIIGVCTDSLVRQAVTILTFRHFLESPVMGDDAVAIHIYDRWIRDGQVRLKDEADWWSARLFAESNRQSLIGCHAPEITLFSPDGAPVTLYGGTPSGEVRETDGRYSILYFYDTGCARCKVESILLRNMLENDGFDAVLYAVYTGKDPEKWERYREQDLDIGSTTVKVIHLWDPDLTSGMSVKYGVIRTPRLFLISPSGTIVGRNLDTGALETLLASATSRQNEEYGSEKAMRMFRSTFQNMEDRMGCSGVDRVAAHIEARTLGSGDTLLYRQLTGDLLYYLSSQRKESYKCGTIPFIDRYILSRGDIWDTGEDSLKVVELALLLKRLGSLCPEGERLPKIKTSAVIVRKGAGDSVRKRKADINLCNLKNAAVIFHTDGCPVCQAEMAAADSAVSCRRRIAASSPDQESADSILIRKAVLIDMDEVWNTRPELAERLMQNFDLSALPFTVLTDDKGYVRRKYISLIQKIP